jgi:hypothetical protein
MAFHRLADEKVHQELRRRLDESHVGYGLSPNSAALGYCWHCCMKKAVEAKSLL